MASSSEVSAAAALSSGAGTMIQPKRNKPNEDQRRRGHMFRFFLLELVVTLVQVI